MTQINNEKPVACQECNSSLGHTFACTTQKNARFTTQKKEWTIWLDTNLREDTTEIRVQAFHVEMITRTQVSIDGLILDFDASEVGIITAPGEPRVYCP